MHFNFDERPASRLHKTLLVPGCLESGFWCQCGLAGIMTERGGSVRRFSTVRYHVHEESQLSLLSPRSGEWVSPTHENNNRRTSVVS